MSSEKMCFQFRQISSEWTAGSRISSGSEFQTVGPATEKARLPNRLRRKRGIDSWHWRRLAERRRCRPGTSDADEQSLARYRGAWCWSQRWTVTASLYCILWGTVSQCICFYRSSSPKSTRKQYNRIVGPY